MPFGNPARHLGAASRLPRHQAMTLLRRSRPNGHAPLTRAESSRLLRIRSSRSAVRPTELSWWSMPTESNATGNRRLVTRIADAGDLDAVARLLLATSQHYWGRQEGMEAAARHAADALVQGRSNCRALLGWLNGKAVAYATFAILHPGPTEHGVLFMKDLFVLDDERGKGLGEAMMRELAVLATERRCSRFDWTAETSNPRAIAFYDLMSAERVEEKVYFRLSGENLARFADSAEKD